VPGHEDAYFRLQLPTEAVAGAGDEVLDFSALFQYTQGAGTPDGGARQQRQPARLWPAVPRVGRPGTELFVHIFGVQGIGGQLGTGAYTLDIDVLPQAVSVESQPLLPGQGQNPGGPTASLVITFQGDRLDPATAEGNQQLPGHLARPRRSCRHGRRSGDCRPERPVYDPSTNVSVASGNVYPTAIRQTVTLLFTDPLPAGSYQIELMPAIQTAAFNDREPALVVAATGLTKHPVVSLSGSQVIEVGPARGAGFGVCSREPGRPWARRE